MTDEAGRGGDSKDRPHPDYDLPWLRSDQYRKAAKDRRLSIIVGGVGLLAGILAWAIPAFRKEAPGLTTVGPVWFGAAVSVAYVRYYTALRRYQEMQEVDGSTVSGFTDELKRNRHDMIRNRLTYGNQARNADRNSQAAMILGFIFITGFSAVTVFLAKAPSSRIVFAGVAVVGAAYSAYISKTFMAVRESALTRFDRVSSRMELETALLLAERMVYDTAAMSKSERLDLIRKLFETRLLSIERFMEKPNNSGDRFGASARRRKALTHRRRPSDDRQTGTVKQPSIGASPARMDLQEMQSLLLELGSRLQLEHSTGTTISDESSGNDPSAG